MSALPKVVLCRNIPKARLDQLRPHSEPLVWEGTTQMPRAEFLRRIRGAEGLMIVFEKIDEEALDAAGPQLKVVSALTVGTDQIDLDLCRKRGVRVGCAACEETSIATAEHAVALAMAAGRRFEEGSRAIRQGIWGTGWSSGFWLAGKQLCGSVVGVIGLGNIGSKLARLLSGFGVAEILYSGPREKPESASQVGATFAGFDTLLERSDFVFATCSANESNKGMFNAAAFSAMKQGSVFVNVARGRLVDQEALLQALTSGHLGAAGLDVTTPEPLPTTHPLLALPNVVMTPHVGNATVEARGKAQDLAVRNLLAGISGKPLVTPAWL